MPRFKEKMTPQVNIRFGRWSDPAPDDVWAAYLKWKKRREADYSPSTFTDWIKEAIREKVKGEGKKK